MNEASRSPIFPDVGVLEVRAPAGFGGRIIVAEPVLVRAPASVVWDVVTGFASYPAWNPLNRSFVCDGGVGASATLDVCWGPYDGELGRPSMTIREVVTVWEPGRCFAYADDRGRLHRAERVQALTETPDGTRYQTWERWAGWISPLISALYERKIQVAFHAASLAVKARAESLVG